jgi:hypothetical protein
MTRSPTIKSIPLAMDGERDRETERDRERERV